MSLKEKYPGWALITGASSGIGHAFATYLAAQKIPLILVARREDRLRQLATELSAAYRVECHVIAQDLTALDAVERVADGVGQRHIDILVNNAGFGLHGQLIDQDATLVKDMVILNALVPTMMTHRFAPAMVEKRRGAIIFLASVVAYQPFPLIAVYAASKGYDLLLGEALYAELKDHGIDVITVSPGTTTTEFHAIAKMKAGGELNKPRTPMQVVETAFAALGEKPSVVDGFKNKLSMSLLGLVPRRFRPGILKKAMHGQAL